MISNDVTTGDVDVKGLNLKELRAHIHLNLSLDEEDNLTLESMKSIWVQCEILRQTLSDCAHTRH